MCQPMSSYDMAHSHAEVSSPETLETPQRSRNARAQARHRAKRKAYIEKLEENVAKLQAVLGLSSEQLAELPPASVLTNRYAELEVENRRLHEQVRSLQHAIHNNRYSNGHQGPHWSPDSPTVSEFPVTHPVPNNGDSPVVGARESKKRKISFEEDALYTHVQHPGLANNNDVPKPNGSASRAHPLQASVNHALARGRSADMNGTPFSSSFSQQANVASMDQMNPIAIKAEPSFGDLSILASASFFYFLSPTLAASPASLNRPPHSQLHHQQQQHQSSGPIDIDHQGQQGQYRMSFSPTNGEHDHQQQAAYSGIVGNAARSIFGSSDDETYLPGNPSPIDSRGYNDQQQYLAHERLASIAQQGHAQQHNHHQQQQQQQGDLSPSSPGGYQQQQQHPNGFTSHHNSHQYTNHAHRLSGSGLLHHHPVSGIYNLSGHNGTNGLASPIISNAAWAHTIAAAGPGKRA